MASSVKPQRAQARRLLFLKAPVSVAPITAGEIEPAVRLFLEAFYDSARLVYGDRPKPDAMVDVWSFAREVEPGGFLAASDESGLIGYALFTSSQGNLRRKAIWSGRVVTWALRALSGRYGVRFGHVGRLLWNKAVFVGNSRRFRSGGDAQLLNIAVASRARGKGVATTLMQAGLRYLAECGVAEVRLEVEPDNAPAIAVYRSVGCVERGRMRDIHGDWIVMTASPRN